MLGGEPRSDPHQQKFGKSPSRAPGLYKKARSDQRLPIGGNDQLVRGVDWWVESRALIHTNKNSGKVRAALQDYRKTRSDQRLPIGGNDQLVRGVDWPTDRHTRYQM
jgi:hypothetical protein